MRTNARVWIVFVCLGLLFSACQKVAALLETSPREVHVTRLVLDDDKGNPRAVLEVGKDGAVVALYDAHGNQRAGLGETKEGPWLTLYDDRGARRIGLLVDGDGPKLSMYADSATEIVKLNNSIAEVPGVSSFGEVRVRKLTLVNDKNEERAILETTDAVDSSLRLMDKKGQDRFFFGVADTWTEVAMQDQNRKHIAFVVNRYGDTVWTLH